LPSLESLPAAKKIAGSHISAVAINCWDDEPLPADTLVRIEGCTISDTNMPGLLRGTHPNSTTAIFHDMSQVEAYSFDNSESCDDIPLPSMLSRYSAPSLAEVPNGAGFTSMASQVDS
jgi:hypothetical protein